MNFSRRHHPHSHTHRFDVRHLGALPSLATNRLIGFAAGEIIALFIPIFLYEFFGMNLQLFFAWYVLWYAVRIPLFIFGAKIFSRIGLSASMVLATFCWALFYIGFYLLDAAPLFFPFVILATTTFFLALGQAFYWSPFHVDFAKFSKKEKRGRQLGVFYAIQIFLTFTTPILGGFLVSRFSYGLAFLLALFVLILSLIPLAFIPNKRVKYEFGFFETFKKMFSREYGYLTVSMSAAGIESVAGVVIWPVFLFIVFKGDYLGIGIFAAAIVVVSIVLQLFAGKVVDKWKPKKILPWGIDMNALGWIIKAFVTSITGVFAASVVHKLGAIMMKTPMDTLMYEKAADAGHYIDEFTTIREIALSIGRAGFMALMIFVTMYFSISTAFVIAAVASLGINLLTRYHSPKHTS